MQNTNYKILENDEDFQEMYIEKFDSNKPVYEFAKRLFDILMSLMISVFAIPTVLITCLAVVIESQGSPIYKQERLGKDGVKFNIYKIRSMYMDAEKNGPKWADKNDDRVTKVGKFIRKTRIDELPQIFNILKGDMTIVGPRPERAIFTYQFEQETPGFINRLQVKPGLTGLAQVNGGYDISYKEKLKLDMQYIRNRGFLLDIKIMLKTFTIVFSGEGAR